MVLTEVGVVHELKRDHEVAVDLEPRLKLADRRQEVDALRNRWLQVMKQMCCGNREAFGV